jgi:hypothetical protein
MLSGRAKIEQRPGPRVLTPQKGPDRRMRRHWPWPAKNFSKCDALHTLLLRRRIEFKIPRQGDDGDISEGGQEWTRLGYTAAGSTSTSRRFGARQPTPRYCLTAGVRNLARAQSHRRKAARRDLAILVRYRPGRRPTIECRVMFCEIVGSIALAGALDPEDFARRNRPISLPATDDRRSRWRVSSPKYVGRPRASLRQQV